MALAVKNPPDNAGDSGDLGSIPGSGRSPGGEYGNPLQYSCLENPMNRGAWGAIVHRVAKSWIRPKQLSMRARTTIGREACWKGEKSRVLSTFAGVAVPFRYPGGPVK